MAAARLSFLLAIPTIFIGLFLTRSPFMMASNAPTDKPWANGPIKLITTPQYETKKVSTGAFALPSNPVNVCLKGKNSSLALTCLLG
jgi:hypothetical protein